MKLELECSGLKGNVAFFILLLYLSSCGLCLFLLNSAKPDTAE